jgi:hypothetical protein
VRYHWPFVELMRNIKAEGRDVVLPPLAYFLQQTLLIHPLTAPIWITGLTAFFASARLKPYRALGWSYVASYTVFFALHGKNYYLAPIYPMLLAAGAVMIETAVRRPRLSWIKPSILAVLLLGGAFLAPVVVPILSPDRFIAYMKFLPFKLPVMEHAHARALLPQWYSDQFGWNEIVAETALAFDRLDPAERGDCGIFAQDYGQAGAVDFLGRRYGLPRALSGHQTWFLWGPRGYSGNCMIVLDDRKEVLERYWRHVEYVGTSADNPYALEKRVPVLSAKMRLSALWRSSGRG